MTEHEVPLEEAVGAAEAYGVDVSMLRERLRLSPTERLRRHQAVLELSLRLREAGIEQRAQDRRATQGAQ